MSQGAETHEDRCRTTRKRWQEIDALQVASNEVVTGLKTIGMSINTVLEYATATASAVEEQSIVTQETSTVMQNTAGGITAINDNMIEITTGVKKIGQTVKDTENAAQVLVR